MRTIHCLFLHLKQFLPLSHDALEFSVLLPQPLKFCDYIYVPPHLTFPNIKNFLNNFIVSFYSFSENRIGTFKLFKLFIASVYVYGKLAVKQLLIPNPFYLEAPN